MSKLALLALALALVPSAADAQPYPLSSHATKCREAGTVASGAFHYSEHRVTRSGTAGSGLLLCPVDFVVSSWTLQVIAHVVDTIVASNLSCSLMLKDTGGTTVRYQTQWTTGSSEAVRELSYVLNPTGGKYAVLSCLMAANVGETYTKLFGYTAW